MKSFLIYLAAVICLGVLALQVASLPGRWLGFTRETWKTTAGVGYHRNEGAVFSPMGLFIFFESEQHGEAPWWGGDSQRWAPAGSPPQFTVSGARHVHDLRFFGCGYVYSVRDVPEAWTGQYHLLVINPLVVVAGCGLMLFLAVRRFARRRRVAEGCCQQCGYDLRGTAHEKCPECGVAILPVAPQ